MGVNLGALAVKVVALRGGEILARVVNHQGRPLEVLEKVLASDELQGEKYVGVCGHLGHISEVAAIQRALEELDVEFDAIASLGGESFLVYIIEGRRVLAVQSHNKCAAGSGEFFVQQIGRMGLEIEEAIDLSFHGKVVPLASRCSVHCKSDITHKLNRHEASAEDILHSLHNSMANKVVSLLEKGQRELKKVLVIGGMTRNRAMIEALRTKLPRVEIVVLPESVYFEAFGAALLTRDQPRYRSPEVTLHATMGRLPSLDSYGDRVRVIPAPTPQVTCPAIFKAPLLLGVDAGSTTTKAVLLDPVTGKPMASHYGRTHGDPVGATQECLRALIDEVGNQQVSLVGTTGSAREIIGAYLDTEHVYNEISAHAAGATYFDPDVDTIFEIGGQDSKYIYLRNGVPVDYAMNNACSAGTGSFLEESAQGDLGIPVTAIADVALAAPSPVQFKGTCAAFINSDIRTALQEGHTYQDIAAGLVYSIANNYLTKVKGMRYVGKKIFLQGGVALNRAVGNAFVHNVGREVVIPPRPELLGAQGVALLTRARAETKGARLTDLATLAKPKMKLLGRFTCRACTLYCTVERFEVAGRRFPFGGRCSLYENVWKRRARSRRPAPDLVERRQVVLFGRPSESRVAKPVRVGIPRALTAHSLYPLYSTFLSRLGMDVVLSGVDPHGEFKAHSGFCFPAQIAHGAVLDLKKRNVDLVFFPHVVRMPNPTQSKDSYLCPITQAGPYVLAKAFPRTRFLSPELDFSVGYESSSGLVDMAVKELNVSEGLARGAFQEAVKAQGEAERELRELGSHALEEAVLKGDPAILLVGRSYNAFTPEASQSVGKKLASMGITVIPADCLPVVEAGPMSWHFANLVMNAVRLAKHYPNLFILYVSNFSCTIDSFTHSLLSSELGAKPYLMLEIDAHTADAGVQTRLEAFLDIVRHYQAVEEKAREPFRRARLTKGGAVITSSGERVLLTDPRVKVHFPAFSDYHSEAWAMAARWLGLHPGVIRLERSQLERGLRYTSGRECLPLPICTGQLLQIHENRGGGELAGLYMIRGAAPCAVDAFMGYFERLIEQQRLPDLFVFSPHEDNDYCGWDLQTLMKYVTVAVVVADLMVEVEQSLRVVGREGSVDKLKELWASFVASADSLDSFHTGLPWLVRRLTEMPRVRDPAECPRVMVTGDFFTRFSPFFMEGVPELYQKQGIILKSIDMSEMALYATYVGMFETARDWRLEPGYRAMFKACSRVFLPEGQHYLEQWMRYQAMKWAEERYRAQFEPTGLLVSATNDMSYLFEEASKHISALIFGEAIPTVGRSLDAEHEGFNGIIVIGPFNCLPFRISEAILKPLCHQSGMPILTYESDGYAVPPSFLRQVNVHIQQVLDRWSRASRRSPQSSNLPAVAETLS